MLASNILATDSSIRPSCAPSYSVLTYIIGDYEIVHEVREKDPCAEYILVTDNPSIKSTTWTVVLDKDLEGLSAFDKCYRIRFGWSRYCHSDVVVRIDASIEVLRSLKPIVDDFNEGKYDIGLMLHPLRSTIPEEYAEWVEQRGYSEEQAHKCLDYMKARGYDFSYRGLFQMGLSIHRSGSADDRICNRTFSIMKELGSKDMIERLDQTVFTFVMNTEFSHLRVMPVSEQLLRSAYLQIYLHRSNEMNLYNLDIDASADGELYLFNRKVLCKTFFVAKKKEIAEREAELLDKIRQLQFVVKYKTQEVAAAQAERDAAKIDIRAVLQNLTFRAKRKIRKLLNMR